MTKDDEDEEAYRLATEAQGFDFIVGHIHDSLGYMRIESVSDRGDAFLKMWHRPRYPIPQLKRDALLHPTETGHLWCRHGENEREQFVADAHTAGMKVDDRPDGKSFWSVTPEEE